MNRYQSFDQLEIYDDMGGLAACKRLLGPARDIKNSISEHFSWLDHLDNFDHLFNDVTLEEIGQQNRKVSGIKAGWQFKKEQKRVLSILKRVKKCWMNANCCSSCRRRIIPARSGLATWLNTWKRYHCAGSW